MHNGSALPLPPPLFELAAGRAIALLLDFDGTLVEIADTPDGIDVAAGLGGRLESLSKQCDGRLALISGRAIADLRAHLGCVDVRMIGSHGAEFGDTDEPQEALARAAMADIAALAARWPALLVEQKPHGFAVHYRQEPDAASSVLSIMEQIAERECLAVRRGKMVVELGPRDVGKGLAVERLMASAPFAGAIPLFLGDDMTDEDGFAVSLALGGHAILVGPPRPTAATFRLASSLQVHQWLNL